MLAENNFNEFLNKLASKAPVPGGGGASALVGAVGTALAGMVSNLTTGKKKYEAYEEDIQRVLKESSKLADEMTDLVQKDAEVFEPLAKAYGLPKETEEERKHKEEVMEEALKLASSVPMEIMEKCMKAIQIHGELVRIGSRLAISDVGVGVILCQSALRGASLNIFINTKLMKNREEAEILNKKADEMLDMGIKRAEEIFKEVENALR